MRCGDTHDYLKKHSETTLLEDFETGMISALPVFQTMNVTMLEILMKQEITPPVSNA